MRSNRLALPPWSLALVVAGPILAAYLILAPPAGDLAAATYRSELFARVGFSAWDTGWYAAHGYWLPAYSLLSPVLGALLGVRALLAICALAASLLFALIAERALAPGAARAAAAVFALGVCVGMLSGRVPYYLGFAVALGSVLALLRGRLAPALVLAVLAAAASPVAGAFLALAAIAGALAGRIFEPSGPTARPGARECLLLGACALAPILVLSLAYPNGGYEPFAASAFWPVLAGVILIALLLPRGQLSARAHATLRAGAALYALALIAAYAIHTPMGGNAARLGALLAAPLMTGVLWERRPGALALLALPLLYWQLATPIRDYASIAGDPSVSASYYAPPRAELRRLDGGRATIVEVPLTRAHWESAYLAGREGVKLARGWERQLDTRYGAIFYEKTFSAVAYRAWLAENRVRYVALPDAPLDHAGAREGALVAAGLPYLREFWHSQHWRIYRFVG
ncbi:MAG: hypothetical protein ACRDK4_08420 [Solirubrobacteraceae bacterium]